MKSMNKSKDVNDLNCLREGFEILKGNKNSTDATKMIQKSLSNISEKQISVAIIEPAKSVESMFIMSITPDSDTVSTIAKAILKQDSTIQTIAAIWRKSKSWTLHIDSQILDLLSSDEMTAFALHELGHVLDSDAIPTRIHNVVEYTLATGSVKNQARFKHNLLNKFLKLPILSACQFNYDPDRIKKEIRADKLAVSYGYSGDLLSAMVKIKDKIKTSGKYQNTQKEIGASYNWGLDTISSIEKREHAITKKKFQDIFNMLPSGTTLHECAEELYLSLYPNGDSTPITRWNYISESATVHEDRFRVFEEWFGGRLESITQNQVDYIRLKVQDIHTVGDKMMIVSYINGKLELVSYYKELLSNPKTARKYKIPHSMAYLDTIEQTLIDLKERAIAVKIASDFPTINVEYPEGYRG